MGLKGLFKKTDDESPNLGTLVTIGLCTIAQMLLWLPCIIYQLAVLCYVRQFRKEFGKQLDPVSTFLCDDLFSDPVNCSLSVVLQLRDPLSLQSLREIFERNVIKAEMVSSGGGGGGVRYPELTQYPVTFKGYKFWKSDPDFRIENHVYEKASTNTPGAGDSDSSAVAKIHESLFNREFPQERSPWELVLLRGGAEENKTFLAMRIHHCMVDGKSVLKLVVECLGGKKLKTAQAQPERRRSLIEKLSFIFLLPFHLIKLAVLAYGYHLKARAHPMWNPHSMTDNSDTLIEFSSKIPLSKIKTGAREAGVIPSALILSGVTGALQKFNEGVPGWDTDVSMLYPLPKPDHPPTLGNHAYNGFPIIPFVETDKKVRLRRCHEELQSWKSGNHLRSLEILLSIFSTCSPVTIFPILQSVFAAYPSYVTNNAGEEEGFCVGGNNNPCEDFTLGGTISRYFPIGIAFYVFSYKGHFRVAASARGSRFSREQLSRLRAHIDKEFDDAFITK